MSEQSAHWADPSERVTVHLAEQPGHVHREGARRRDEDVVQEDGDVLVGLHESRPEHRQELAPARSWREVQLAFGCAQRVLGRSRVCPRHHHALPAAVTEVRLHVARHMADGLQPPNRVDDHKVARQRRAYE